MGPVEMETAMIAYTSRIAERIPTIEAFFIDTLESASNSAWCLQGWLDVQNFPKPHTIGPLTYKTMIHSYLPVIFNDRDNLPRPPPHPPAHQKPSRYSEIYFYV